MSSEILTEKVVAIVRPIVELLGYQLWGIEIKRGKKTLIRIYAEAPNGIGVEDCANISRQVSGVLDVELPTLSNYELEVSSPGLNRILFDKEHYAKFLNQIVQIKLRLPLNGRRNFQGEIREIKGSKLTVQVEGSLFTFELMDIAEARLVPQF
jgi:ribosome maturation factor RimP